MDSSSTNIHFDYDGHYSKSGDDYEWIPTDDRLYAISFKTSSIEEIAYLFLKKRICKKITINPQSKIFDEEDVFVYLTSVDKEQRRNILHVEVIKELVEKVSSYGGNYSKLAREIPKFEGNPTALTLFTPIEEPERYLDGIERKADDGGIGLDNMSMENEENVDNYMGIGTICEYVELPPVAKEITV
ncbi:hypothetical protein N665_0886s0013, partial [Sinapis alba]